MSRQEVVMTIFDDETPTTVAVKGVKGTSCKALTKPLEQALGTVVNDKPTAEMTESPLKQKEQQRQRSGGL
jgi:hypothetical protein